MEELLEIAKAGSGVAWNTWKDIVKKSNMNPVAFIEMAYATTARPTDPDEAAIFDGLYRPLVDIAYRRMGGA